MVYQYFSLVSNYTCKKQNIIENSYTKEKKKIEIKRKRKQKIIQEKKMNVKEENLKGEMKIF